MANDKLTPDELAAENERLKLACQAYRKFIQAEMHFEGYRGEFYGQKASEQNCLKLEAWLKEHGLETAGDDLLAELAALREQVAAEREKRAADLRLAIHTIGNLSDQQAMHDGWYEQPLQQLRDQLAALDKPEGA